MPHSHLCRCHAFDNGTEQGHVASRRASLLRVCLRKLHTKCLEPCADTGGFQGEAGGCMGGRAGEVSVAKQGVDVGQQRVAAPDSSADAGGGGLSEQPRLPPRRL